MSDPTAEADETSSGEPQRADGGTVGEQTGRPSQVQAAEEVDWRGWLLVGMVIFAFLVMPAIILFIPQMSGFLGSLGLSVRQAYLVFPMIPAVMLGVTAVWAAVRSQAK